MDASALPNQALAIFDVSSKKCCVGRCHDRRQHTSPGSSLSITWRNFSLLTVELKINYLTNRKWFITDVHCGHTASPFSTPNACHGSPYLVHDRWRFRLSHVIHFSSSVITHFRLISLRFSNASQMARTFSQT